MGRGRRHPLPRGGSGRPEGQTGECLPRGADVMENGEMAPEPPRGSRRQPQTRHCPAPFLSGLNPRGDIASLVLPFRLQSDLGFVELITSRSVGTWASSLAGQALGGGFPGTQAPGVWARPVPKAGPRRDVLPVRAGLKEVSVWRRQWEPEQPASHQHARP